MIHILSLLHTMSVYANRWGGPNYRTEELAKFLNKHLYNVQEEQLRLGEKVNTCLSHDALLSSRHTPLYMSSIRMSEVLNSWRIKDELGFEGIFAEGTEILIRRDEVIRFEKIENLKAGDKRVINFELVPIFNNDKLPHFLPFNENFLSIKCETSYETQMLMCDGLTAMMILKEKDNAVTRLDQFDSKNTQEVYLVDIVDIKKIQPQQFFWAEFNPFSYKLSKNRALSDKSNHRYYKQRRSTVKNRFLEKMRSKVFNIKKDNVEIKMELKHVSN